MNSRLRPAFAAIGLLLLLAPAQASPWAEVGDNQLRSDIEILAAAGVIDGITTHWPLPWASIVTRLRDRGTSNDQPALVRAAAARVLSVAQSQMRFGSLRATATIDGTNRASVVRGFDGLGRETAQGQLSLEYMDQTTAFRLGAGAELHAHTNRTAIVPDGSYIAQKLGGAVIYGGYLSHWWGPGWVSALSVSNNARPMPQIGIERDETSAFETPWLSWLGPWQFEFMVGLLDDSRVAVNTVYDAMRFTFNPLPGLEIGLGRTQMLCGTGHPCAPLRDFFAVNNDPLHPNHSNEQGLFDIKYSSFANGMPFQLYMQLMNEDSNPISHSVTSHLFGGSIWLPIGEQSLRITAEYTNSVPTLDIFSFGDVLHGAAYNNADYIDGMRYRGRTLGFSLDSDSTLLTLQSSWRDSADWRYQLTLHHAAISNPNNTNGNIVTTAPVHINMGEARVSFPFRNMRVELAGRLQDDQPRPYHGFQASIEAAITYNL